MRLLFFGTSAFAVPSLERLAGSQHSVVACVTQPDRPKGRGLAPEPSPVKQAAQRLGVAVLQPERPHADLFRALSPEAGVVVAYGQMIRRDLLELPAHGMLGVHPSLLPKYRGAAPIARALLNGERMTGVTIFRLTERLDAGDTLIRQPVTIEPREDAGALAQRLAGLGAEALLTALEALADRRADFEPQDERQATLAPKLTKADGRVDWTLPAEVLDRRIRALVPWPGTVTEWRGRALKLWRATVDAAAGANGRATPGTVLAVAEGTLTVAAGQGALVLDEVQPAGRRRMSVREFLTGHPLRVGDQLGRAGVTPQAADVKPQTVDPDSGRPTQER